MHYDCFTSANFIFTSNVFNCIVSTVTFLLFWSSAFDPNLLSLVLLLHGNHRTAVYSLHYTQ